MFLRLPTNSTTLQEVGFFLLLFFISTFWANLRGSYVAILGTVLELLIWDCFCGLIGVVMACLGGCFRDCFGLKLWAVLWLV